MGLEGVYMNKVSIREYQPRLANIYIYTHVSRVRLFALHKYLRLPYTPFRCSRHVCWLILWSDFVLSARIIIHEPIGRQYLEWSAWFMDMQYCSQSRYRDISMPGRMSRSVNIVGEYRNLSVLTSRQFCPFFPFLSEKLYEKCLRRLENILRMLVQWYLKYAKYS